MTGTPGRGSSLAHLFVANRGEIAGRIATTAGRLGMACTVPSLDGPDRLDLLDPAAVVAAARAAGADSVHPGYGFLAESPALATAVIDAGLAWVGPPPAAIRALGDKAEARAIALRAGVPVAEGDEPADQSDDSLAAVAARIGYPVLVKPAAGGGGKGIRVVLDPDRLPAALSAARREAGRSFGDGRLLVERYVERARHVEVQVLADRHGEVAHLGERDCSLQRRHQKLLEEAPAPGLDDGTRRAVWAYALALARAVGYEGAGTCEFLVGDVGEVVFLEVNARLQVEHPVTELLLERDLVADQLAITAGARLSELGLGDQEAIERRLAAGGHAIEVRLNAEDPASGFLPSAGRVAEVRWPAGAGAFGQTGAGGVRVDAGIANGDTVTGRFDPLLAKVIAHGPDRATALARLAVALNATEVLGLPTNLGFLRRLVRQPVVVDGLARTTSIEEDEALRAAAADPPIPEAAWVAAADALLGGAGDRGRASGWAWGGAWRANLPSTVGLVADTAEGPVRRTIRAREGTEHAAPAHHVLVRVDGVAHVSVDGRSVAIGLPPPPDLDAATTARAAARGGSAEVLAPMPGAVIAVHVTAGTTVEPGTRLATIEAMKMEHDVTATSAGVVDEILVRTGDQVARGDVVARIGDAR
ncbi:MAG TPA: biotin carboxylase N-terminal domain-containing protein [Candidatus Limnocylindrales bacterium]|nr:biotin carboxylase N-terminal domain-containing protein [Candidatus Limnocylindrales bacterium]